MKLSDKAQKALDTVVETFKNGDLSPIVKIVRIQQRGDPIPADRWSLSNRILAYVQSGSLDCRGYRQWQEVGRQVKKGATAVFILAPCTATVQDEKTGEERQQLFGFRGVAVFAHCDTVGEPLPEYDYRPRELPPLADVAEKLDVNVTWKPLPTDRLGDCDTNGEYINLGTQDPQVFFHELAHACHARLNGKLNGGQDKGQETVAEFTSAVLMQLYGLGDRTGNAWEYIKHYSKDPIRAIVKALKTVEQVLALIESTCE